MINTDLTFSSQVRSVLLLCVSGLALYMDYSYCDYEPQFFFLNEQNNASEITPISPIKQNTKTVLDSKLLPNFSDVELDYHARTSSDASAEI